MHEAEEVAQRKVEAPTVVVVRVAVGGVTHLIKELGHVVNLAVDEEPDVVARLVLLEVLDRVDLGGRGGSVSHFGQILLTEEETAKDGCDGW